MGVQYAVGIRIKKEAYTKAFLHDVICPLKALEDAEFIISPEADDENSDIYQWIYENTKWPQSNHEVQAVEEWLYALNRLAADESIPSDSYSAVIANLESGHKEEFGFPHEFDLDIGYELTF